MTKSEGDRICAVLRAAGYRLKGVDFDQSTSDELLVFRTPDNKRVSLVVSSWEQDGGVEDGD
jgi:hypothetical protein